jgi:hypothetical protein
VPGGHFAAGSALHHLSIERSLYAVRASRIQQRTADAAAIRWTRLTPAERMPSARPRRLELIIKRFDSER